MLNYSQGSDLMEYDEFKHLIVREKEVIEAYCNMFNLTYKPLGWNTDAIADVRPDFIVNNKRVEVKI